MLRHRRHDVLVFHVLDDDELTFPFAGMTRFEGMEELPRPAVRPAGAARRLPRSAGRVPGRGAPRLHPDRHRLQPGPDQRLPGRGAVAVPVRSGCRSAPTPVRTVGCGPDCAAEAAGFGTRSRSATQLRRSRLETRRDDVVLPEPVSPWSPAALLVSSPIIIHLINRMRFRRVRWAAMEFLLKAQKRMRRKMILEQLILLLLRCLLVFLVGLLFGRFLGFDPSQGKETRPTVHVVILDDTPSMADRGLRRRGQRRRRSTTPSEADHRQASCPPRSKPPPSRRSASSGSRIRSIS